MTHQRKQFLVVLIVVVVIATGLSVIGTEHARHMKAAYEEIVLTPRYPGEVVGPMLVDQSVCRYMRPGFYSGLMHWLTCYSCVLNAREIDRLYTMAPMKDDCPSRGTVSMTFIRK